MEPLFLARPESRTNPQITQRATDSVPCVIRTRIYLCHLRSLCLSHGGGEGHGIDIVPYQLFRTWLTASTRGKKGAKVTTGLTSLLEAFTKPRSSPRRKPGSSIPERSSESTTWIPASAGMTDDICSSPTCPMSQGKIRDDTMPSRMSTNSFYNALRYVNFLDMTKACYYR